MVGIVLWDKDVKNVSYVEGLYAHSMLNCEGLYVPRKDRIKYTGVLYCADCVPRGVMSKQLYAIIRRDYGLKEKAYCSICNKLIAGCYDEKRKLFVVGE